MHLPALISAAWMVVASTSRAQDMVLTSTSTTTLTTTVLMTLTSGLDGSSLAQPASGTVTGLSGGPSEAPVLAQSLARKIKKACLPGYASQDPDMIAPCNYLRQKAQECMLGLDSDSNSVLKPHEEATFDFASLFESKQSQRQSITFQRDCACEDSDDAATNVFEAWDLCAHCFLQQGSDMLDVASPAQASESYCGTGSAPTQQLGIVTYPLFTNISKVLNAAHGDDCGKPHGIGAGNLSTTRVPTRSGNDYATSISLSASAGPTSSAQPDQSQSGAASMIVGQTAAMMLYGLFLVFLRL